MADPGPLPHPRQDTKQRSGSPVDPEDVRAHLERLLASGSFRHAGRLSRFLRFVAERTLDGRGGDLKEYLIGVEVFDRPASFDPRTDSVVRVEARRLRAKLRDYYDAEGRDDPVGIELPKGTYAPSFSHRLTAAPSSGEFREAEKAAPGERAARGTPRSRRALLAAALVLCAVAAIAVTAIWGLPWASAPPFSTIAVLPFDSLSSDQNDAFFSDGLLDEVTTALAKVDGLRVVARNSASQFRRGQDVSAMGRRLKATAVLEGSVRRDGARLRVTAQLINTSNGYHLWSETFERDVGDVFAVQDDISDAITTAVSAKLSSRPSRPRSRPAPVSAEAQGLVARGRYFRRERNLQGIDRAIEAFQRATSSDPAYARAYAALAEALMTKAFHEIAPQPDLIGKARAAASEALRLDATMAEAHGTLGAIGFFHDWDWPAAERAFRRALEINPSYAEAHQWYALGLVAHRRLDEGVAQSQLALELDPLSYAVSNDLAVRLYCARRFGESIAQARAALEADPKFFPAHAIIGSALAAQGRYREAVVELETALAVSDEPYSYLRGRLAHAYALAGRREDAVNVVAQMEALGQAGSVSPVHLAYAYTALGDHPHALELLEQAARLRDGDVVFIGVDPIFDPLAPDPRFRAILDRLRLPAAP